MKTIALLVPLTLLLASCQYGPGYPPLGPGGPYPPQGYPEPAGDYRAIGTEPFWDLNIGRDMVFTDRGNNISVVQPTPRPINGFAGEIYQTPRLNVNIVHAPCSDGMSDRTYPDRVQVRVDGRQYEGCGGPADFWARPPGEGPGYHGGPGDAAPILSGTNWRVVAINGRPTPPRNFYLNFMPDRIGAKFGCNGLGGTYTQSGSTLTAGPIIGTKMACPDMSFETEGSRVLSRPMTVRAMGDRITLTNANGSIDLVQAR